jgi:phosphate transport system substrate-binding protein
MKRQGRTAAWVWLLLPVLAWTGCRPKEDAGKPPPEDWVSGNIHISCDESFKPVIDQQVAVYESLYPAAHIIVHYKPEAECLRDFGVDSIRLVIATRGFSEPERRFMADSMDVAPQQLVVAHDLIAVVVHPSAKDTFFNMQEIRDLLTGKTKENLIPVFDGVRATSTVRFMLDSVLRGAPFGSHVAAAQSSLGVLDYVSRTPNAVGFVGFSWIGNPDDSSQRAAMKKVRTAYVESTDSAGAYVSPSQYFIYTKTYPMVRDLVYVLKERPNGLAHGFANFLSSMPGQLIFRRGYLMPVILPNYVRDARLQDTINK